MTLYIVAMEKKEIVSSYRELKGVLEAIPEESWFYDNGFVEHGNKVINRVAQVCPEIEDINIYLLSGSTVINGSLTVNSTSARQKVLSLLGRMEGLYALNERVPESGNTFIQNQSQSQSQHISLVLELQAKILQELPQHEEGTKERTFLEKMRDSLPTLTGTLDALSTALKIGAELGLDPSTIRKLLGI